MGASRGPWILELLVELEPCPSGRHCEMEPSRPRSQAPSRHDQTGKAGCAIDKSFCQAAAPACPVHRAQGTGHRGASGRRRDWEGPPWPEAVCARLYVESIVGANVADKRSRPKQLKPGKRWKQAECNMGHRGHLGFAFACSREAAIVPLLPVHFTSHSRQPA